MSAPNSSGCRTEPDTGADPGSGAGASGEGAGSALEAMLRKRRMRVSTESDPAAAPTTQKQDGKTAGE
jgi:hypothetical protein